MSQSPPMFTLKESGILLAAGVWAHTVSEYFRNVIHQNEAHGRGEALIGLGLWGLFLWWLSKRYGTGWTMYWFVFAVVTYAPFADVIDRAFGGVLGLSTQD